VSWAVAQQPSGGPGPQGANMALLGYYIAASFPSLAGSQRGSRLSMRFSRWTRRSSRVTLLPLGTQKAPHRGGFCSAEAKLATIEFANRAIIQY
jgi:hypothetical protein